MFIVKEVYLVQSGYYCWEC